MHIHMIKAVQTARYEAQKSNLPGGSMNINKMMKHIRIQVLSLFSLLPFFTMSAQDRIAEKITHSFLEYCESVPREEIYMHTDRNLYIAGEELWFDVYLFDRKSNKISAGSKLAYVEVLNSVNQSVLQKRVMLDGGNGPGMFFLPDTLSTGNYLLRAYTSRMKNFLPENCFMKEIIIYNALSSRTIKGRSIPAEKKVMESNTGLSLDIADHSGELTISILCDQKILSHLKGKCYVFIQTHGNFNCIRSVQLNQEKAILKIEKKLLIPGVNEITVFDQEGKPLISENIFTPAKGKSKLVLKCSEIFRPRQKVILEIDQDQQINIPGNMSISVAPVCGQHDPDIMDYMVFGSEFGIIPDEIRSHRLSELSPGTVNNFLKGVNSNWIDWNRIMNDDPGTGYPIENEDHYLSGKLLNNDPSVTDSSKILFLSIPGKNAVFQYARTNKEGRFTFRIPVDEELREIVIQPESADRNSAIKIESSFAEKYSPVSKTDDSTDLTLSGPVSEMGVNYQVTKIYDSGSVKTSEPGKMPKVPLRFYGKTNLEIRLAEYVALPAMQEVFFELVPGVNLKNKKSVFTMEVADRVNGRIFDKPPLMLIDGVVIRDPSVIAALDPDKIERIDAVKDLYLVGDYMIFGIVNVISKAGDFSSVTLPDYAVRLKYRVVEPVKTFCSPEYSSATPDKRRIPDFRNTLYWNPSVKPDTEGNGRTEFWSSDRAGDYEIIVQGIDHDGNPVSGRKIIKISQITQH
jgi:hypothetical protein